MSRTNAARASGAETIHREPTGQVRLVAYERRFFDVMTAHFGDRFLQYRRDWARSAEYGFTPDFPLSLDLETHAGCNLKCVMCVMGDPDYQNPLADRPRMDGDLYRSLMEQGRAAGLPAMTFGFLSEPLLDDRLPDLIRLARRCGVMDVRLGTNGLLLGRAASQSLIDAGLTRLEVSIDAYRPETYRKVRRGGRLETVRDNVFRFLDLRRRAGADFPVLRISFLNLPQNRSERGDFLDFWRPHADLFSIQEPIYFERAPISRDVNLVQGPVPGDFRCAQPNQRLIVRADGTAYPCCSIYGLDMPAGSVADRPLADIWTNTLLTGLRGQNANRRHRDNPICAHCADRSYLTAVEPNTDKETPHVG